LEAQLALDEIERDGRPGRPSELVFGGDAPEYAAGIAHPKVSSSGKRQA
jgi:hypothetical protein